MLLLLPGWFCVGFCDICADCALLLAARVYWKRMNLHCSGSAFVECFGYGSDHEIL